MKRKVRYILARVVGVLAIALLTLFFVLQLPAVQTKLAQRAVTLLDKVCDAKVSMSAVKIYLPGSIVIKDLLVLDNNPLIDTDTLIFAETIAVSIRLDWLFLGEGIHLSRVTVENGGLTVVPEDTPHLVNINRILRRVPPEYPPDAKDGNIFDLRRVDVNNFHFRLINKRDTVIRIPPYGINFGNLDLTASVRGHDLHFTDGLMYGTSDHCDAHENNCGYDLLNLTGNCRVGKGMALVENIHIVDKWSDWRVKMYSMEYRSPLHIRYLAKRVKLELVPESGNLSMQTLKQFTGNFDGNMTDIEFRGGRIDGYLRDLGIQRLEILDRNSGLSGIIDGRIVNVNDPEKFGISMRLIDFTTTTEGFGTFLSQWSKDKQVDLRKFAPGQKILLNASAKGRMRNLQTEISIKSPSGNVSLMAGVKNLTDKTKQMQIGGNIVTRSLALNRIVKGLPVGKLDMTGDFSASLGKTEPNIKVDSIHISSVDLLGGTFSDIKASAGMKGENAYLKLASHDPALDLSMFGCAGLGKNRYLKFAGNVRNVSLDALGLAEKVNIHNVATEISADISEDGTGKISGDVRIPSLVLQDDSTTFRTGAIEMKATGDERFQKMILKSDIADITFAGTRSPVDFLAYVKEISIDRHLSALLPQKPDSKKEDDSGNYDLTVNFHKPAELLEILIPGAWISDSTKLCINVTDDGIMRGAMASSRLELGSLSARKVDLSFDNAGNALNLFLTGRELNSGKIKLQNTKVNLYARDNGINAGIKYDNSTASRTEKAALNVTGTIGRDKNDSLEVDLNPYLSYFNFNGDIWQLNGNVHLSGGNAKFNGITIKKGAESLSIEGGWAAKGRDKVKVTAEKFGIDFFDRLLGLNMGIDGRLDGYAIVESPLGAEAEIEADLNCTETSLGAVEIGKLNLTGGWDRQNNRLTLSLRNINAGKEAISASLKYTPKTKQISATAKLDKVNLALAKPMMQDLFSDMGGYLNGEFSANGTPKSISVRSKNANLEEAMIKVALTGVTYHIDGKLDLHDKRLEFNDISIKDDGNGSGRIDGAISFGNKFDLTTNLKMNKIKVLDTPEKHGTPVYGLVETSGDISIKGTSGKFDINADILADSPGNIHIPLNTALVGSTSDLLTFVKRISYGDGKVDLTLPEKKKSGKTAINANGRLRISRNLVAWAEIDKTNGNKMKVSGDGDVAFNINSRSGQVKLNGTYSIDEGYYHFVIPGLLEKDFNIGKGSNVTLAGDAKDVALDIKAVHPVRASLATLLADTTATSTRTAVDCIIGINGKVSSPRLSFDIEIPDIDPTTKAKVETALNTEDKKQKQFMSLLLFGTFMPAEESGVINGTNMLYSNVGEIMSGQVNSIMQKLDIPVDFGFGYQQSIKGDNMYDVAVSTQLFNNRVLINGSVGSRQSTGTGGTTQSNIVGDIDIAVKLDKKGRWRVSVFSRSANEYTSFIDNSQRSGLGVSYQKEFSTIKELFTSSKRTESALPPEDDNKVIIKVE